MNFEELSWLLFEETVDASRDCDQFGAANAECPARKKDVAKGLH
jgi:hypothetical protein